MESQHLPESDILTLSKLSDANKAFLSAANKYGDKLQLEFELYRDSETFLTIKAGPFSVPVCHAKAHILGAYGSFADDLKPVFHWIWPWVPDANEKTLVDQYNSDLVMKIRETERKVLADLVKGNSNLFEDPMMISYCQAVLLEELGLSMIYNVQLGSADDCAYLSFGITDPSWISLDEFKQHITVDLECCTDESDSESSNL